MSETRTMLHKIAEAFEQSAQSFSHENKSLSGLFSTVEPIQTPTPHQNLVPGVWLDFEGDKGTVLSVGPGAEGKGLRISMEEIGDSRWVSFSYKLSGEALRDARYFGILMETSSEGFASFRPCLRYLSADGLNDRFARETVVLSGADQEDLVFIRLDQDLLRLARQIEVHFFFEGRNFDVTLNSIENLSI